MGGQQQKNPPAKLQEDEKQPHSKRVGLLDKLEFNGLINPFPYILLILLIAAF